MKTVGIYITSFHDNNDDIEAVLLSTAPPYSGRGVYTFNLYRHLKTRIDATLFWKYRFNCSMVKQLSLITAIVPRLKKLSKRRNLIVHFLTEGAALIGPVAIENMKKVATLHDVPSNKLLLEFLKDFDAIITVSEVIERKLKEEVDTKCTYTIHLGVDTQIYDKENKIIARRLLTQKLGLNHIINDSERPYIIFTSDDDPRKHVDRVVEVIFYLKHKYGVNVKLLVLGKPREELKIIVEKVGLSRDVLFIHNIPLSTLIYAYNSADLMLYLSTFDACPLVVLEAMACGLPVISTPVGSVPVFLRGFEELLVKDWRDIATIAEMIYSLLSDYEKLNFYSTALRERAQEFSWERVASKTIDVYRKLLLN